MKSLPSSCCKVWIQPNHPCRFGTSVFDSLLASSQHIKETDFVEIRDGRHCDVMSADILEYGEGGVVSLAPSNHFNTKQTKNESSDVRFHSNIPFGRAKDCPTLSLEVQQATLAAQQFLEFQKKNFVSLAVVGMVHDSTSDSLLITRRPAYMRSFPGAYVFPGGGVHEHESLVEAVSREVFEETGIEIDDWKLESLWESIYPTFAKPGVPIKAHHLVCYFSGRLNDGAEKQQFLNLCSEEVDGAVWLSRETAEAIASFDEFGRKGTGNNEQIVGSGMQDYSETVSLITNMQNEVQTIPLKELMGIYPRNGRSGELFGIAQGSLFALQELLR